MEGAGQREWVALAFARPQLVEVVNGGSLEKNGQGVSHVHGGSTAGCEVWKVGKHTPAAGD